MTLGEKLFTLRRKNHYTQETVANAIGISRKAYNRYEADASKPRKARYQALADFFHIDVSELLYTDSPTPDFLKEAQDKYGNRGVKQAKALTAQLVGMFAGGKLPQEDQDNILHSIEEAYWAAKNDAKKFTPNKYKD